MSIRKWLNERTKPIHTFEFFVPFRPRPKQRDLIGRAGKGGRGMMFPNPENKPEQEKIRHSFIRKVNKDKAAGIFPHVGPVRISTYFCFRYPKNYWEGKEFVSVPDLDNLEKLVKDSLKGAAWIDDRQVVGVHSEKFYYRRDGTVVVLEMYEDVQKPTKKKKSVD